MGSSPPVVAVVGPTASGKSAVALAAAGECPGSELVSIDAFAVYQGMDIGTAKPTAEERAAVPHHLVDVVEAVDEFTVAEFQRAHDLVRADLARRGVPAILVGGTGLYHRVVVDGLELPGQWPAIRERLEREVATGGAPALHERLGRLDPVAAGRMEPTNARRVVRALEVCEGSGRPFSSFGPGLDAYPHSPVVQIGLRWDRDRLTERIDVRVRSMVERGWLAEVERLRARGGWSRTAGQAVGYDELAGVLDGRLDLDDAIDSIVARTRRLAVRQERWFRRDPRIRWVDVDEDPLVAVPVVVRALSGLHGDQDPDEEPPAT